MSHTQETTLTALVDGNSDQISQLSATGEEVVEFDAELSAGLVDEDLNIGIADSSYVKSILLINSGTADITSIKLDAGVAVHKLGIGEVIFISGPDACKAFLDDWSAATTFLVLKVSTPAGPALAHLKVLVITDAMA